MRESVTSSSTAPPHRGQTAAGTRSMTTAPARQVTLWVISRGSYSPRQPGLTHLVIASTVCSGHEVCNGAP